MYAVISHRTAAAVTIDGQTFEHQRWTLVDSLTEGMEAATIPPVGQKQPELRVLEVDGPDDPRLAALPVIGQEATLDSDAEEEIDLNHASLPALKKLAGLLGLSRSQGRADLIAAIQAKHAQIASGSEPNNESEPNGTGAGA